MFTIDGDFQRAIPVQGRRNWSDFLELTPGVHARPFDDGSGRLVYFGHGTEHFAHVIQIEGAVGSGHRDSQLTYIQMSTDMIADVEVRSGGVDAAQPIGTGLVMNIVTKSGGNQLNGTVGYTLQPMDWNGNNDPGGVNPSTPTVHKVGQLDYSLGGPVKRDKLWFFTAGRLANNEAGISRAGVDVQRLRDYDPNWTEFNNVYEGFFPYGKLTANAGKHLINAYYQYDKVDYSNMREYHGKQLGTRQTGGGLYGFKATSILSDNLSTEFLASYNNKTSAYSSADEVAAFGLSGPEIRVHETIRISGGRARGSGRLVETGNFDAYTVGPSSYLLFRGDLTYFRESGGGGSSHEIQTGVFAAPKMTRDDSVFYSNGGFTCEEVVYRDANDKSLGTVPFHRRYYDRISRKTLDNEDSDLGLYLQDAWSPNDRLTVNVGARVDFIERKDLIFGVQKMKDTAFGPRFGFTYMLTDDGNNVLRGSLNRVHEQVNGRDYATSVSAGSTERAVQTDVYDNDLDGIFETVRVSPSRDARVAAEAFADDLTQPYVDEAIVGYRRQLGNVVAMDIAFIHRQFKNRYSDIDINGYWPSGPGQPFGGWGKFDPDRARVNQVQNNQHDKLVYNAIEFTITKRMRDNWQFMANLNRQWHHMSGTWNPTDRAGFIEPEKYANNKCIYMPRGRLDENGYATGTQTTYCPTWRNYSVRLGATWLGPLGITFGGTFAIQDGPWSGAIRTLRPGGGDPAFGPPTVTSSTGATFSNPLADDIRYKFATRGDGQEKLPDIKFLNIAVGKQFRFAGDRQFEIRANIINLFNWGNFQQYTYSGANQDWNPNFLQGRSMQAARGAQLFGVVRF